jgi:hypothetical protein
MEWTEILAAIVYCLSRPFSEILMPWLSQVVKLIVRRENRYLRKHEEPSFRHLRAVNYLYSNRILSGDSFDNIICFMINHPLHISKCSVLIHKGALFLAPIIAGLCVRERTNKRLFL